MQLKIANLASVSRRMQSDTNSHFREYAETPISSGAVKDMNKMIVMSGTAKRNSFKKLLTGTNFMCSAENQQHESFSKLRAPFYKTRQKQSKSTEKLMSKSCELLFEYLKPYKHINTTKDKKCRKKEWDKTIGSILETTNVVYQKTATRKVEILRVLEENSNCGFNKNNFTFDFLPNANNFSLDFGYNSRKNSRRADKDSEVKENFNLLQKTVSSEDFINNVF